MYYPLMIDLKQKSVVVFGGGNVAKRKVEKLLEYGANVRVVSQDILNGIAEFENTFETSISIVKDTYSSKYICDCILVIAATCDRNTNEQIASYCSENNILCNVVDDMDSSSFIVPSSMRCGDMTIAISTMGKSPSLCKKIKEDLETRYCDEFAIYVELLGQVRKIILQKENDAQEKKRILKEITDMNLDELKKFYEDIS